MSSQILFVMLNVSRLEPFGIFTLAGGLLYAIGVLTVQSDGTHYRWHFIVLTLVIFLALFTITIFKYLKYRYTFENIDNILVNIKNLRKLNSHSLPPAVKTDGISRTVSE